MEKTDARSGFRGHTVIPFARTIEKGQRADSNLDWVADDISNLRQPQDWKRFLKSVEVVANASGALKDCARDNLRSLQDSAIQALIGASETAGVKRLIQICAPGAEPSATTCFMHSKTRADEKLRQSTLDWLKCVWWHRVAASMGSVSYCATGVPFKCAGAERWAERCCENGW
jgi:uncharacterized protein YbjT (DUF2867 family)